MKQKKTEETGKGTDRRRNEWERKKKRRGKSTGLWKRITKDYIVGLRKDDNRDVLDIIEHKIGEWRP